MRYHFRYAIMSSLLWITAYFGIVNLTKEPGYQIYLKLQKNVQNEVTSMDITENGKVVKTQLLSLREIVLNLNNGSIILSNGLLGFFYSVTELVTFMEAIQVFNWNITMVGLVTITAVFLDIVQRSFLLPKYTKTVTAS